MAEITEQKLGFGFGVLGGALVALGGLLSLVLGTIDLVVGRPFGAIGAVSEAVILFVVGGLAMFFAWIGHREWSNRPFASGVLLVMVAVIGWAVLGLGANLIALIGSLFVFLAGVLFLLEPAKKVVTAVASA
jgi:hypothetical protein